MSKHIALQARDENHDYTVIIKRTPELEALIRRRMDLAATAEKQDPDCWGMIFKFYDFEVYEDLDQDGVPNFDDGDVAIMSELPEVGEPVRKDYGALVIDSDSVYLRFGIKHVPDLVSAPMFEHVLFEESK